LLFIVVFFAFRPWLIKNVNSLQLFVYTYIRVIEDHEGPRFKALRQMEVEFCVSLIRENVRCPTFNLEKSNKRTI